MTERKIPVYELFIDDENVEGLMAMGLVNNPAIQQDFIYFNKMLQNKYVMSTIDKEKRMIVGPALIPNKKIIRQDLFGDLYYAQFPVELVEKLAHNFIKESNQHNTTEQHENPVKDIYLVESWIVKNENDKIFTEYGYSIDEVFLGTWCVMYKIENDDILSKIKAGEINGFSVEAYLSEKLLAKRTQVDLLLEKLKKSNKKEEIIELLKNCEKNNDI